jgi:hypothetical protein
MNIGKPIENAKLQGLAVLVTIVCSAVSIFLLLKLNGIVHGALYNFGLQFNLAWASPYWDTERLIYVCLAIPPLLNGLILVSGFLKSARSKVPVVRRVEATPSVNQPRVARENSVSQAQVVKENGTMISCPKCRKVFGRPLSMLDFSKGTTRLVNVCPYCNHVLDDSVKDDSDDTRVIYPDEKEVKEK